MKILIFGAAGFVGRNLIERLSSEHTYDIIASDAAADPFQGKLVYPLVDLLNRDRVSDVVKGTDVIVRIPLNGSGRCE